LRRRLAQASGADQAIKGRVPAGETRCHPEPGRFVHHNRALLQIAAGIV